MASPVMELPTELIEIFGKYKKIEKTLFFTRLVNELPETKMALLKVIVESIKADEIVYDQDNNKVILSVEPLQEVRIEYDRKSDASVKNKRAPSTENRI